VIKPPVNVKIAPSYALGGQLGADGHSSAPAALHPRKSPGMHCRGGCVGSRVGLEGCEG
jgi:hypothetical protein